MPTIIKPLKQEISEMIQTISSKIINDPEDEICDSVLSCLRYAREDLENCLIKIKNNTKIKE